LGHHQLAAVVDDHDQQADPERRGKDHPEERAALVPEPPPVRHQCRRHLATTVSLISRSSGMRRATAMARNAPSPAAMPPPTWSNCGPNEAVPSDRAT